MVPLINRCKTGGQQVVGSKAATRSLTASGCGWGVGRQAGSPDEDHATSSIPSFLP